MSTPRKISVRKVLRALVTLIVVAGCIVAVMGARQYHRQDKLKAVQIILTNGHEVAFHNKASIEKLLFENAHMKPEEALISAIDLNQLENKAKANPWIADANLFVDNKKNLNIIITQRVPAVRLFDGYGNSFYLDSNLTAIPLSPNYVAYLPVVSGMPLLRNDSTSESIKALAYYVAKTIEQDKFWNAQVSEIIYNGPKDFTLVPNIGNHVVRIGDTTQLQAKLSNVLAFYQKVMNKIGWDKYTTIDVRFKNQIVTSPSLPWKAPVDKAMGTMNWVKSIIGDDTVSGAFVNDDMDGPPTAIAADIQIVPAVSMDALQKDWILQEATAPISTDSLRYVKSGQTTLVKSNPTIKPTVVKAPTTTATIAPAVRHKMNSPADIKARPTSKPMAQPSTKAEPNNTSTNPKPVVAAKPVAKPDQPLADKKTSAPPKLIEVKKTNFSKESAPVKEQKPKYILEH